MAGAEDEEQREEKKNNIKAPTATGKVVAGEEVREKDEGGRGGRRMQGCDEHIL